MVHFRKPKGRPMPEPHQRANHARSAVRSAVEHVFADQKARMGLFIRTIGLGRATVTIGIANLAYNFRRLAWLGLRGELRPHRTKTAAYFRIIARNWSFGGQNRRILIGAHPLSGLNRRSRPVYRGVQRWGLRKTRGGSTRPSHPNKT